MVDLNDEGHGFEPWPDVVTSVAFDLTRWIESDFDSESYRIVFLWSMGSLTD
jgi:hypothetical protein